VCINYNITFSRIVGHVLAPGNCLAPGEFEARMAEYVKILDKELRRNASTPPSARQGEYLNVLTAVYSYLLCIR
jgi:hypothetical protein